MDFGSFDIAIILGLIVIVIFLGSVLWRLHSAMDMISKGRRYYCALQLAPTAPSHSALTLFALFDAPGNRVLERVIDHHFESAFGELRVNF